MNHSSWGELGSVSDRKPREARSAPPGRCSTRSPSRSRPVCLSSEVYWTGTTAARVMAVFFLDLVQEILSASA